MLSLEQKIREIFATFGDITASCKKNREEFYHYTLEWISDAEKEVLVIVNTAASELDELLQRFPREKDFLKTSNLGSFQPLPLLVSIYKWKEICEKKVAELTASEEASSG